MPWLAAGALAAAAVEQSPKHAVAIATARMLRSGCFISPPENR
jgi:hypothetical protein